MLAYQIHAALMNQANSFNVRRGNICTDKKRLLSCQLALRLQKVVAAVSHFVSAETFLVETPDKIEMILVADARYTEAKGN